MNSHSQGYSSTPFQNCFSMISSQDSIAFLPHVTDLLHMKYEYFTNWFHLLLQDQNFGRASSVLLPGYKQAVRNCPWVVEFWTSYGRAQERLGIEHEELVGMLVENLMQLFSLPLAFPLVHPCPFYLGNYKPGFVLGGRVGCEALEIFAPLLKWMLSHTIYHPPKFPYDWFAFPCDIL